MSIARGEYLSFLDSDDFFHTDLFLNTTDEADKNDADIVVYRFEKYNTITGEYSSANYAFHNEWWPNTPFNYTNNPDKIFNSFNPCAWNKLFRHSFVKNNKLYFQENKRANDLFFTSTALASAKRISLIDKVLVYYRIGTKTNSQSTNFVDPYGWYRALIGIKNFLVQHNLFEELKNSYKILATSSCIYNVKQNKQQSILLYNKLIESGFKELEIDEIPAQKISEEFYKNFLDNLYFKHVNLAKNENHKCELIVNNCINYKPKISVIIPIYNDEEYIIECLESIINQMQEIEIICVNDGSTDNSLSVLKDYAKKDSRIKIISQENSGPSQARNSGVKFSQGEYIYFIDGDDYLEDNALLTLYNKANKDNLDILYFDADSFLDNSNLLDSEKEVLQKKIEIYKSYYKRKGDYNEVMSGTEMFIKMRQNKEYRSSPVLQLFNTRFYEENNLHFYNGILHEDNLFSLTAILLANKVAHISKNFYKRRVRYNSIMTNKESVKNLYGHFITYCQMLKFLDHHKFDVEVDKTIRSEMNNYLYAVKRIYDLITDDEKKLLDTKLDNCQKQILDKILQDKEIAGLNSILKEKDKQIVELNSNLKEKDKQIVELNSNLKEKDKQIVELNSNLKEKDKEIVKLKSSKNDCIDVVYNLLSKARLDIKSTAKCEIICKDSNTEVTMPSWIQPKEGNGVGYVLTIKSQGVNFQIKCLNDGMLELNFRTTSFKDANGKIINYLVDIKDIRIDDISVVSAANHNFLSISHDKPFRLSVVARKGQIIPVIFKYDVHHYEWTEFRSLLSSMMATLK